MPIAFSPNRLAKYDDESVLTEMRRVIREDFGGMPPAKIDFDKRSMVTSWVIRKRFGSWANGIQRAGFDFQGKNWAGMDLGRKRYLPELMISDLERVRKLNGDQYFSQDFYLVNGGRYSVKTLKRQFDCSWSDLLKEHLLISVPDKQRLIIYQPRPKPTLETNEESLLIEIKRVWDELGRRPSYSEFKRLGRIGMHAYEKKYGTWKLAVTSYYAKADPIRLAWAALMQHRNY